MSRIGPKDSRPETVVRRLLHGLGYRFRLHRKDLPGTPDIVLPGRRKIVFVHGCWWHRHEGCPKATPPKTNAAFWNAKFDRNVLRDASVRAELEDAGWQVHTVWECRTRHLDELAVELTEFLERDIGSTTVR